MGAKETQKKANEGKQTLGKRKRNQDKTPRLNSLDEAELENLLVEEMEQLHEFEEDDVLENGDTSDDEEEESEEEGSEEGEEEEESDEDDSNLSITDESLLDNKDEDEKKEIEAYLRMKNKLKGQEYKNDTQLTRRLEDIKLGGDRQIDWLETLLLTTPKPSIEDVHDDLARETCFYSQAISSVIEAHQRFREINFPNKRPPDYFAEMVKSDDHMAKIRKSLLERQKKLEDSEIRKRERDLKKFGKQVQVQKVQEKNKKKKENFEAIKKWRKRRQKGGVDEKYPIEDEEGEKKKTSFSKKTYQNKPPNKKRKLKDERYGFGGGKRNQNPKSKRNDAKSSAEDVYMPGEKRGKNQNFKNKNFKKKDSKNKVFKKKDSKNKNFKNKKPGKGSRPKKSFR